MSDGSATKDSARSDSSTSLPARQLVDQWRPIETAPKDQTEVLVFHPGTDGAGYMTVVWWDELLDGWLVAALADGSIYAHGPTHWMPLPAPPALAALLDPAPPETNAEDVSRIPGPSSSEPMSTRKPR